MKIFLFVCLALLILMLVILAVYLVVGNVFYRLILTRKGRMVKKIVKYFDCDEEYHIFDDFEKIEITSEDDLKLCGYYKDNNHPKLAILVHGYGGNHTHTAKFANYFIKRGYDILAIDQRCHGESQGRDITMGRQESQDLLLWINKMLELKPAYKILLFGVSMGASTVCITCGKNLPSNVVIAVEDSGYDNADRELRYMFLQHKILSKLCYKIFYNYTLKTQELDLKKVDAISSLKSSKIPMMFIHGDSDKIVPTEMVYNLSSQIPQTRRGLFIGSGAGHVGSYNENARDYERALNEFLSKFNM